MRMIGATTLCFVMLVLLRAVSEQLSLEVATTWLAAEVALTGLCLMVTSWYGTESCRVSGLAAVVK